MGYESFAVKDIRLIKILQNAKKFGAEAMQNEALLKLILDSEKMSLTSDDRANIEKIFSNLVEIKEKSQLSK